MKSYNNTIHSKTDIGTESNVSLASTISVCEDEIEETCPILYSHHVNEVLPSSARDPARYSIIYHVRVCMCMCMYDCVCVCVCVRERVREREREEQPPPSSFSEK